MQIFRYLAVVLALGLTGCAALDSKGSHPTRPHAVHPKTGAAGQVIDLDTENLSDLEAETDLWERIRHGFAIPELQSPLVADRTQWYAVRHEYVERMATRSSRYLYHIVDALEKRGMPTELALLPFVESAFDPQATSTAKAAGMWQFMPATGRTFNLKQNLFRDERRDVLASTDAALDYLQKLYRMFGDWQLALAAYNWGEGSVQRAIAKNRRVGLPTDYASLVMPAETRYYVPKLLAIKNLVAHPEQYGVKLPVVENRPYFVTVTTSRDIDVDLVVKLAGMTRAEFLALNPSYTRPIILGATHPQILLPFKNAESFQKALDGYGKPLASWTAVTLANRERVEALASRLGVDSGVLREVNGINRGMRLGAGSTVLVPRAQGRADDISPLIADNARLALEPDRPDTKKVSVRTRKGDTVKVIAARYQVSPEQLRSWNRLSGEALPAGKVLTLVVPAAVRAPRADQAGAPAKVPHPGKTEKIDKAGKDGKAAKAEKNAGKADKSAKSEQADKKSKAPAKDSAKAADKANQHSGKRGGHSEKAAQSGKAKGHGGQR